MPIPDFQSVMHPLMSVISDGKEHSMRDALDRLADHFKLSEDERKQLLPSGQQALFTNRVAWAKTHLRMAGLIEATARGVFKITASGQEVLRETKSRIDMRVLQKEPCYLEARGRKKDGIATSNEPTKAEASRTPDELIGESIQTLRENLGREILEKLKDLSPEFFEKLVVKVLVKMGYGGNVNDPGQVLGKSGDGGIDGIIMEDHLGLGTIHIQAKKWAQTVGRPDIQQFSGALKGVNGKKGVFFTTSDFSKEAVEFAAKSSDPKIVLIDGEQLWKLMVKYGIGVSTTATYTVHRIDNDYFSEEMG